MSTPTDSLGLRAAQCKLSASPNHLTRLRGLKLAAACLLGLALCWSSGCWSSRTQSATSAAGDARDASDKRAKESIGSRYWYDPSTEEYRTPKISPDPDHPLRRNGAKAGPTAPRATNTGWTGLNLPSGEFLAYSAIIILGVTLTGLAIVLLVMSVGGWRPLRKNVDRFKAIEIDPSRVSDLPFEAQAEMHDPLAYAKQLIGLGKYEEAMLFLYGYMLLALDRAGKISLHRGKTNRMYLHELHRERQLHNYLVPAMLAFEDVFFGRHRLQPERFQKIWAQLDDFHRALAPAIAEIVNAEQAQAQ